MKSMFFIALMILAAAGCVLADCPKADLSGDCKVTLEDYALLANQWLDEGIPGTDSIYPLQSDIEGAYAIHLTLTGQIQGAMHGNSTAPGREDTIVVTDYNHSVKIPLDPLTGLATGQRQHGVLTIEKFTDQASPLMIQALTTGERLSLFKLDFYRLKSDGTIEKCYEITLQEARIVDYKTAGPNIETFSFSYDSIEWHWIPDNKSAQDDWRTPAA